MPLLYMLSYLCGKQSNLLQVIVGHFLFTNNILKHCVESLHQIGRLISSETIWQALNTNAVAILKNVKDRVQSETFYISYDNMNFYENVCD